jgi:predicted RNA polymerase sigma factor
MLQKAGRTAEAKAAYTRYLAMAPSAPDAPFIRQLLQ